MKKAAQPSGERPKSCQGSAHVGPRPEARLKLRAEAPNVHKIYRRLEMPKLAHLRHPLQRRPDPLHLRRQGRIMVEAQPVEDEPFRPGRPDQAGVVALDGLPRLVCLSGVLSCSTGL